MLGKPSVSDRPTIRILNIYWVFTPRSNLIAVLFYHPTAVFDRMASYPDYKVYTAEADGEIVGTFALAIMDNLAHMGAPSGLIEDVVVKEECRGLGIGKKMMLFALERCREAGCYKTRCPAI